MLHTEVLQLKQSEVRRGAQHRTWGVYDFIALVWDQVIHHENRGFNECRKRVGLNKVEVRGTEQRIIP